MSSSILNAINAWFTSNLLQMGQESAELFSVLLNDPLMAFIAAVCLGLVLVIVIIHAMPMPGVRCPNCAKRGIEQWVLPGKHCPRCATAC